MPRPLRPDFTNLVVHVINRAANRAQLFFDEQDYFAFERVLREALKRVPIRVIAFCVMPNHWHFVVQPRSTEELSRFMKWLTQVHARRWRQVRETVGGGALYQSRYKAFPMSSDEHLLLVVRYVERNALRAGLVHRAEDWPWGSAWHRENGDPLGLLTPSPVPLRSDWSWWLNEPQTAGELEAVRACISRSRPLGEPEWVVETAARLGLENTLRHQGRPFKMS